MKVLINGHFISCDDDDRCFSVMIIDNDKIVYTGDTVPDEYADYPSIDMHGHTVVPAFSDTHMHFESYALFRTTVDVRDVKNFEEMVKCSAPGRTLTRKPNSFRLMAAAPTPAKKNVSLR